MSLLNNTISIITISSNPIWICIHLYICVLKTLILMNGGNVNIKINIIILLWFVLLWARDLLYDNMYKGEQTTKIRENLLFGYYLFLISEIIIFGSLFFTFYYNFIIPSVDLGYLYPPFGITPINLYIPLFNTLLLLWSSITITIVLFSNSKAVWLLFTIILNLIFSYIQINEYIFSSFSINDSIFGSILYTITGLHGLHVFAGTLLCIISLFLIHSVTEKQSFVYITSIYLHFVDVVWILVFFILYL